jgi:hypothetical protein
VKQTLDFLESFLMIALALAGLAGISYNLFRDDGWLEAILGNFWDYTVRYPLIAIPLLAGAVILGKMWRDDRVSHGKQSSRAGAAILYVVSGAGVYFIGHYVLRGSL